MAMKSSSEAVFPMKTVLEKMKEKMKVDVLDKETTGMVEWLVVLRISTKTINLWIRQLEMKRKETGELARLMGFDDVKSEIEKEKKMERWAKRCTTHFTKKTKRMLYEEIDNFIWSGKENGITNWCMRNKVYDEITENEIQEIWNREDREDEHIRLNGKYVWKTAKRVCDFINAHEDLINITTFGEYQNVMKKVMRVIKEAHITEKKRRQTAQKNRSDETNMRTQRTKALITEIKRGKMRKGEIIRRLESIFGEGSGREIETATTKENVVERITEMLKAEELFEEWERMRKEAKKQREDRRLNLFWRKNKSFPTQFGRDEETPEVEETLEFWRRINNKEVSE